MVGEHPVTVGGPMNLTCAPDSTPSYLNALLIGMLEDVADDTRGHSLEGWPYGLNYRVKGYSGGSDHVCFADQAFGIPSVMFGSADQFHHTSFDEASRVDSTRLKRVGVMTGGAALTIACADDDEALDLAARTYAYAYERISGTTSRLTSELLKVDPEDESYAESLGTKYIRGLAMLDEAGRREVNAVRASKKLTDAESKYIDNLSTQVKELAEAQKEIVKKLYEGLAAKAGVEPMEKEAGAVGETMKLIPRKTYAGPTRGIRADEIEDEEDRKWFRANSRGSPLGRTTLELMNFVDGERSVYEIAMAISLEYQGTEPLNVKRYLDIYKAAGKITYA
jgi:hypothetical protein